MPLEVELTGWSPFSPGDADNSSLPVAGLEYRFINRSSASVDAVFSFNTENFLAAHEDWPSKKAASNRIRSTSNGFVLCGRGPEDQPWNDACCAVWVDDSNAKVKMHGGNDDLFVASYDYFQPSLVFYCRREVSSLQNDAQALDFLRLPLQTYLVTPVDVWDRMRSRAGDSCRVLGERYDLYTGQSVVLVSNNRE